MSKIIGLAGKGGTGKTTLASLIIQWLISNKSGPVLAIDADPNSNLAENLGLLPQGGIVQIVDEFSRSKQDIPAGLSKDRFLEHKIQEILNEAEGFDLLAMGKPEGPGCYCYINNVLRVLLEKLTNSYLYTVIDNEAGMEHLSRRTARAIDILFIVSDETPVGIRSAKNIYDLAKGLDIDLKRAYLIVNRSKVLTEGLRKEIKNTGIELAGVVPEDDKLYKLSAEGKPVTALKNSAAEKAINGICKSLINGI